MYNRKGQYKTANVYLLQPEPIQNVYSKYKGPMETQFSKSTLPYVKETYKYLEPPKKPTITHKPLEITWNTKKYVNTQDPRVWGPSFWFTLHNGAASYPNKASPLVINRTKGFIMGLPFMLPCENCKVHAANYIQKNKDKLDDICGSREKLFNFFVDFHNIVNKRYNKPQISYEQARNIYNKGVHVKYMNYK